MISRLGLLKPVTVAPMKNVSTQRYEMIYMIYYGPMHFLRLQTTFEIQFGFKGTGKG